MASEELKNRTKVFAIKIFKLEAKFPKSRAANIILNQLLKSASSVAANYRASQRAKSKADFINKLAIVDEECDETMCSGWNS